MDLASHGMSQSRKSFSCDQMQAIAFFDRLPDSLLLLIFNKLAEIKALGRCCTVSKRFNALVLQVENVMVKVDCVISGEDNSIVKGFKGFLGHLVSFVMEAFVKPLQTLQQFFGPKIAQVSHHSPDQVLKNFRYVRTLRIELPAGELDIEEGVLLRWRAEFGSTLENCVILGASSLANYEKDKKRKKLEAGEETPRTTEDRLSVYDAGVFGDQDDTGSIPEAFYTSGGLKLRVVWTISSLIAASARHYVLQQIVYDHPTLERLVLTDTDGQGTLCMNRKQLRDFRSKPLAASASSSRTQLPALKLKLWYAPYLDIRGRTRMRGATLVAIRPSDQSVCKDSESLILGAFEDPHNAAVSVLLKRQSYCLEMNSF